MGTRPTVGWVNKNGFTVLWDEPERPPFIRNKSVRNISGLDHIPGGFPGDFPGNYVLGQNFFWTLDFPLTNIFRRKVSGGAEEFLLGAISVLLIAILSEIVQAILMHTRRRNRRASSRGVHIAFLVDEFYHFRNVVKHLVGRRSTTRLQSEENRTVRKRTYTSLIIVLIALGLMAADVFAVYLTQPNLVFSKKDEYNLRGIQPIVTDRGLTKWIRRLARDRICVTPVFTASDQERQFVVSACINFRTEKAHDSVDELTDNMNITVSSFYHMAGNDHYITFGQARMHIRVRAFLYLADKGKESGARRFYFVNEAMPDNNGFEKFLHELFIYSVMEESCNQKKDNVSTSQFSCDEVVASKSILDGRVVEKEISLFHKRNGEEIRNVTGYQTTYKVTMNNPFFSVDNGVNPLVATALFQENSSKGTYLNLTTDKVIDQLEGLITEEGRMAGLILFLTIFIIFSITLIILRSTLQPVSLGAMAWSAHDDVSLLSSNISDKPEPVTGSHDGSSYFDDDGLGASTSAIGEEGLIRADRAAHSGDQVEEKPPVDKPPEQNV